MRTLATFRTDLFNLTDPKQHWTNPSCFGQDLASWLRAKLAVAASLSVGAPTEEDWGWFLPVTVGDSALRIDIGLVPEETPEWLVHVVPQPRLLQRLRGGVPASATKVVVESVHNALSSEPRITSLAWFEAESHARGDLSTSSPTPAP